MTSNSARNAVRVFRAADLTAVLTGLLSAESPPDAVEVFSTFRPIPGVIAMQPGAALAFASYSVEYDGCLGVTSPEVIRFHADAGAVQIISQLTQELVRLAVQHHCRFIRCLIPDGESTEVPRQLMRAGFRNAGRVRQWSRTFTRQGSHVFDFSGPATISVAQVQFDQHSEGAVCELLKRITSRSDDLTSLPMPDCEALVAFWRRQQMEVHQAGTDDGACGLAVVSGSSPSSSADGPTSRTRQGRFERMTLEYIGVVPEHRRIGVATCLLSAVVCVAPVNDDEDDQPVRLNAFVDDQNEPAVSFYTKSGFQPESGLRLLVRDVTASDQFEGAHEVIAGKSPAS